MSLQVVNDNRLGSHVVYMRTSKPPFSIDHPARPIRSFKIRVPFVPQFKHEPLAYNPGTKPKPTNQFINNYQKTMTKNEPSTHQSPIDSLFRL